MAKQITELTAAAAIAGVDLLWLEQSGLPRKVTMTEISAFTAGGSGTALSVGTVTTTTVAITSDGSVDDVVLPAATVSAAGMLTTAKWAEVVANTAKVTNATHTSEVTGATALTLAAVAISNKTLVTAVATDMVLLWDATDSTLKRANVNDFLATGSPTSLSVGTVTATTVAITSDGSADDVILPAATVSAAGMFTTAKWAEVVANNAKNTNVSTALSVGTVGVNTVAITSDGGADDVTLPAATVAAAGMLTTAKWAEIVANNAKNTNVSTTLSVGTVTATTVGITSDGGADDVILPAATVSAAGMFTTAKWGEVVANNAKISYTDAAAVSANTAKVTNATHTSEVTGATALTMAAIAISNKTLVTAVATDMVLIWDATDSALKRANVNDFLATGSPTSLSTGTVGSTTYGITSDGSADDVIIAAATASFAGVMDASKFNEVVANTAKVTNATHTGDVTGATALTIGALKVATGMIQNSAVTLAKMANVATSTVFYRKTAATGVPEVQTLATLKTDLGLTGTNSGDSGTVTSVSVTTANGVSGTVATATTTPAISLTLGAITPTSVGGITSANLVDKSAVEAIAGAWSFSGENTVTAAGFTFNDLVVTHFGTDEDVDMYMGALDFYINLTNTTADFRLTGGTGVDAMITCLADGGVYLYYNGDQKLQTTNTGVTLTGTLAATTVTGINVTSGADPGHTHTTASITGLSGSNTGDQTITLTTDVTGTGTGSFAATIAADAVTYAKMQNVVADERLLGNIAGAGGIVTELTPTQVRTMINVENGATADQTITLTGDVTGTGTGSFATTIAAGAVDLAMLSATGTPSASTYLRGDNTWAAGDGLGTVTSVSVVTANGISGTVATATTTPAITLDLGEITPEKITVTPAAGDPTITTHLTTSLVLAPTTGITNAFRSGATSSIRATAGAGGSNYTLMQHDGTRGWIDSQAGELYVSGATNVRLRAGGNNTMLLATSGGAVDLYHNISVKISTSATGATVTGTLAATTVTGANVTTGADPGHTHTTASVTGLSGTNTGDNAVNTLYSGLVSNVSTALSMGTIGSSTIAITSDGSADDVILPTATAAFAGVLDASKFNDIVANTAKVTNATHTSEVTGATALTLAAIAISNKTLVTAVATDMVLIWDATDSALKRANVNDFLATGSPTSLSVGTVTATTVGITSDGSADDVILPAATVSAAGMFTTAKWAEVVANNAKVTNATHTGDVTGSTALTIGANKVTLAMMADMATASFLGRNTAATGDPEVLSVATAKTMLNLTGTNSGDQTITLTGDVTGTGTGSFATTIAVDAVDIAMLSATGVASATTFLRGDNTWQTVGGGTGTVTSVSVVTANGVSGSVATATTTPAITLTLGAITPTSVGGITSANLVDKVATEKITGPWEFSRAGVPSIILDNSGVGSSGMRFQNNNGTRGYMQVDDAGTLSTLNSSAVATGFSVTNAGAISAVSYGGITEANLVDKSAVEAIAGAWSFSGENTVTAAGFTFNDLVVTHFGTDEDVDMYMGALDFYINLTNTAADFRLTGGTGVDAMITCLADGGVYLYYNGDQKLQTTNTGVTLTGTLAATTVTGINVTSGANPGHTHTGTSISALDAGDTTTGTFDAARLTANGEFSATPKINITQYNRWGAVQDMAGSTDWNEGVYGGFGTMTNGSSGMSYDPFLVMGSASDVRSFLVVPRTASRAIAYKGSTSAVHTAWHYSGWTTTVADADLSLYAKHNAVNTLYSGLVSNVSTALSMGSIGSSTIAITSDGGADDVILPTATASFAGVMDASKFNEVVANTAKVTNATHTGDVTGSTALTIAVDAVDIAMLSATGTPSATTFLRGDNTWQTVGGSGTVTSVSVTTANGVSGTVATATTTPAISLTLGAITPTSVGGITSANLVDKSAVEAIAGAWSFSGENTVTAAGFTFNDLVVTHFGTDEDVDMYMGALDFYINLTNTTADFRLTGGTGVDAMITCLADGGVYLYYNGDQKLQTTNTGVTLTGTLAATTVTGINVTSGANPGHTHTGSSISALDAGDITTGTLAVLRGGTGVTTSTGTGSVVLSVSPTFTGTVQSGAMNLDNAITAHAMFINEAAVARADVTNDGQIWVKSNAHTDLYFTTDTGLDYPVAYARYRVTADTTLDGANVTETLGVQHINGVWYSDNGTAYTLTLQASGVTTFPVGAQMTIWNEGAGVLTINEGATTTLYILDGAARTDTAGGCTMGLGGYATLIRKSTTVYLIMGAGLTA